LNAQLENFLSDSNLAFNGQSDKSTCHKAMQIRPMKTSLALYCDVIIN